MEKSETDLSNPSAPSADVMDTSEAEEFSELQAKLKEESGIDNDNADRTRQNCIAKPANSDVVELPGRDVLNSEECEKIVEESKAESLGPESEGTSNLDTKEDDEVSDKEVPKIPVVVPDISAQVEAIYPLELDGNEAEVSNSSLTAVSINAASGNQQPDIQPTSAVLPLHATQDLEMDCANLESTEASVTNFECKETIKCNAEKRDVHISLGSDLKDKEVIELDDSPITNITERDMAVCTESGVKPVPSTVADAKRTTTTPENIQDNAHAGGQTSSEDDLHGQEQNTEMVKPILEVSEHLLADAPEAVDEPSCIPARERELVSSGGETSTVEKNSGESKLAAEQNFDQLAEAFLAESSDSDIDDSDLKELSDKYLGDLGQSETKSSTNLLIPGATEDTRKDVIIVTDKIMDKTCRSKQELGGSSTVDTAEDVGNLTDKTVDETENKNREEIGHSLEDISKNGNNHAGKTVEETEVRNQDVLGDTSKEADKHGDNLAGQEMDSSEDGNKDEKAGALKATDQHGDNLSDQAMDSTEDGNKDELADASKDTDKHGDNFAGQAVDNTEDGNEDDLACASKEADQHGDNLSGQAVDITENGNKDDVGETLRAAMKESNNFVDRNEKKTVDINEYQQGKTANDSFGKDQENHVDKTLHKSTDRNEKPHDTSSNDEHEEDIVVLEPIVISDESEDDESELPVNKTSESQGVHQETRSRSNSSSSSSSRESEAEDEGRTVQGEPVSDKDQVTEASDKNADVAEETASSAEEKVEEKTVSEVKRTGLEDELRDVAEENARDGLKTELPGRIYPVCRHWRRGYCAYEDTCKFRHNLDPVDEDAPSGRVENVTMVSRTQNVNNLEKSADVSPDSPGNKLKTTGLLEVEKPSNESETSGKVTGHNPAKGAPSCKHFLKKGRCPLGDSCAFRHDSSNVPEGSLVKETLTLKTASTTTMGSLKRKPSDASTAEDKDDVPGKKMKIPVEMPFCQLMEPAPPGTEPVELPDPKSSMDISDEEQRKTDSKVKKKRDVVCRHFLRGYCAYEDECIFMHSAEPEKAVESKRTTVYPSEYYKYSKAKAVPVHSTNTNVPLPPQNFSVPPTNYGVPPPDFGVPPPNLSGHPSNLGFPPAAWTNTSLARNSLGEFTVKTKRPVESKEKAETSKKKQKRSRSRSRERYYRARSRSRSRRHHRRRSRSRSYERHSRHSRSSRRNHYSRSRSRDRQRRRRYSARSRTRSFSPRRSRKAEKSLPKVATVAPTSTIANMSTGSMNDTHFKFMLQDMSAGPVSRERNAAQVPKPHVVSGAGIQTKRFAATTAATGAEPNEQKTVTAQLRVDQMPFTADSVPNTSFWSGSNNLSQINVHQNQRSDRTRGPVSMEVAYYGQQTSADSTQESLKKDFIQPGNFTSRNDSVGLIGDFQNVLQQIGFKQHAQKELFAKTLAEIITQREREARNSPQRNTHQAGQYGQSLDDRVFASRYPLQEQTGASGVAYGQTRNGPVQRYANDYHSDYNQHANQHDYSSEYAQHPSQREHIVDYRHGSRGIVSEPESMAEYLPHRGQQMLESISPLNSSTYLQPVRDELGITGSGNLHSASRIERSPLGIPAHSGHAVRKYYHHSRMPAHIQSSTMSSVSSEKPVSMTSHTQPTANNQLGLAGQAVKKTTSRHNGNHGPNIHDFIEKFVNTTFSINRSIKLTAKKYSVPKNCNVMIPPEVHADIFEKLPYRIQNVDKILRDCQKWFTKAIIPVVEQVDLFGKKSTAVFEVVRRVSDALTLLGYVCVILSIKRRLLLKKGLSPEYHILCSPSNAITGQLFGDSLVTDMEMIASGTYKVQTPDEYFKPTFGTDLEKTGDSVEESIVHMIHMAFTLEGSVNDLREKYKIPLNCDYMIPPKLNAEIKKLLTAPFIEEDQTLEKIHRTVAESMVPCMLLLETVHEKRYDEGVALGMLTDSLVLLGHAVYTLNQYRLAKMRKTLPPTVQCIWKYQG